MATAFTWRGLLRFSAKNEFWRTRDSKKPNGHFRQQYKGDYKWYIKDLGFCWRESLQRDLLNSDKKKKEFKTEDIQTIKDKMEARLRDRQNGESKITTEPSRHQFRTKSKDKSKLIQTPKRTYATITPEERFKRVTGMPVCTIASLQEVFEKNKVPMCDSNKKQDLLQHFNKYEQKIKDKMERRDAKRLRAKRK